MNELSHTISKSCKTLDSSVLMAFKPRDQLLQINGMKDSPEALQARVLVEGYRALNDQVTQTRVREVKNIKLALEGKQKQSRVKYKRILKLVVR